MKDNDLYPLISVIMLNYNGLEYLKKTIPAVLNQDYPNFEFLIVDNGSTESSIRFIKKFKRIKLIKSPIIGNKGISINYGVKKSNGKKLLLLDNDILISKRDALSNLNKINCKKEILSPLLIDLGERKTKYYGGFVSLYGRKNTSFINIDKLTKGTIISSYPNGGAIFLSREIWENLGGYDENQKFYLDDLDLGLRANLLGYNVKIIFDIFFIHLGGKERLKIKTFCNKYKYYFSGYTRSIIKAYSFKNLIICMPIFTFYVFLKTISLSYNYKSLRPFFSFFYSISFSLANLSSTLKQRKIVQSKRVIKKDTFLKIKPPRFD